MKLWPITKGLNYFFHRINKWTYIMCLSVYQHKKLDTVGYFVETKGQFLLGRGDTLDESNLLTALLSANTSFQLFKKVWKKYCILGGAKTEDKIGQYQFLFTQFGLTIIYLSLSYSRDKIVLSPVCHVCATPQVFWNNVSIFVSTLKNSWNSFSSPPPIPNLPSYINIIFYTLRITNY